jgi:threonyl-tRNA synthetase
MKTKPNSQEYLDNLRHSAAHLLAAAVMELFPQAKRTIGPAIENGFYFDFDDLKVSDEDFPAIEEKMHELVKDWQSFERSELSPEEAKEVYTGNEYKHELIDQFSEEGQTLTFYKSGQYSDLCRGGHVEKPSEELKHFKLLSVAGAYWRGNEKNKMLTRIYGTIFPTKQELEDYLNQLEEAKKRDHRKLAQEMDLIVFSDLVGSGLPLYTPKGAVLRNAVYNYSRELNKKIGYGETALPSVNRAELFKVSGHYDKYKDDMFEVHSHYSEEEFFLKPMNCPQHCVIFGSRTRSYRDLPIRLSDFSVLYRDERPGEIHGLFRSRAFTQDDGHAFVREDQIGQEFQNVLRAVKEALRVYGFEYWVRLSLRDPKKADKYLGDDDVWNRAEETLRKIVEENDIEFKEGIGEAAIYGPKLDFMATDSIGREWQISTIQLDMIMPVRFGLKYSDQDGSEKHPFMIHRAIVGSERFLAILIEHFAGKFPLWLAPIQVKILPITDRNMEYGNTILEKLKSENVRVELDERSETLQAKIRDAQMEKVPYMIIIGDKEQDTEEISIRTRDGENKQHLKLESFLSDMKKLVEEKSLAC